MKFVKIRLDEAENLYREMEKCFIKDELRDYADYVDVMSNSAYQLSHIVYQGQRVGFVGLWKLNGFTFVEHFAIYEQYRSHGFGGNAIDELQRQFGRLVLEVEQPLEENQVRRINFYRRHGFVLNEFPYIQPSYRKDGSSLPLLLMSCPDAIKDSAAVIIELYQKVYKVI